MNYVGIDNGKHGALAVLSDDGEMLGLIDMPLLGNDIDMIAIIEFIEQYKPCHITVEEVTSIFQRMKGYDIFVFGKNYGILLATLQANQYGYELVHARKWKKEFRLTSKDKSCSIAEARQRFPEFGKKLLKSKDGRAEAALIAEYGRRHFGRVN